MKVLAAISGFLCLVALESQALEPIPGNVRFLVGKCAAPYASDPTDPERKKSTEEKQWEQEECDRLKVLFATKNIEGVKWCEEYAHLSSPNAPRRNRLNMCAWR